MSLLGNTNSRKCSFKNILKSICSSKLILLIIMIILMIIVIGLIVWVCLISIIKITNTRIVFGEESKPHAFPYVVVFRDKYGASSCAGSLIKKQWVLTAAHCIHESSNEDLYEIVAGKHDVTVTEHGERTVYIKKLIKHDNYTYESSSPNDIALLYLTSPLRLSQSINLAHLPKPYSEPSGTAIISGWGVITNNCSQILSDKLKMAVINIKESKGTIIQAYPDPENPADSCIGDSGGGLVQKESNNFIVIGVTSNGPYPCSDYDHPGKYTKVSYYVNWIENKIKNIQDLL